ncbi:hypothetical protein HID58_079497 [Brassica napus]|uniref:Uncharacterized protein n=1 Tax=Brassica napus TaxID=3708 RepID=A0ABQ7Y4X1_BRANA|nr:hypothetical protein HID58_079497 [Brassica napus]
MHGYGIGPGLEWSTENWPRSPGEPIRGTIELADRQHSRARRESWLVSRSCSPGELARSFRRLLPIFLPSEIFSAAGRSSGIPSPLNGFKARWSSIDLEPSLSLWMFCMG